MEVMKQRADAAVFEIVRHCVYKFNYDGHTMAGTKNQSSQHSPALEMARDITRAFRVSIAMSQVTNAEMRMDWTK